MHISRSRPSKKPPKFHERTAKREREKKERKLWREWKKARNFGRSDGEGGPTEGLREPPCENPLSFQGRGGGFNPPFFEPPLPLPFNRGFNLPLLPSPFQQGVLTPPLVNTLKTPFEQKEVSNHTPMDRTKPPLFLKGGLNQTPLLSQGSKRFAPKSGWFVFRFQPLPLLLPLNPI